MELWSKEGKFLASKDKAKKVLDILCDEQRYLEQELVKIKEKKEVLKAIIED